MENTIVHALLLLGIGMSSVFLILFIVVSGGNYLIKWVNNIQLEIHEVPFTTFKTETILSSGEAAIKEAVHKLTDGKGRVESIKKK